MKHFGNLKNVRNKSCVDLVSEADLASEKQIVKMIMEKFPEHDIVTEEQDFEAKGSDWQWIIDPLDGTTNYVHSLPLFPFLDFRPLIFLLPSFPPTKHCPFLYNYWLISRLCCV